MAVYLASYAKATGYTLPKTREAIDYIDASLIESFAKDAVKAIQMAGIMNGKNNNQFDSQGIATRAEAAAALHRYAKLIIDMQTAQGLDINDSGSTILYENGRLVKSAIRTVNGNTYTFNQFGEAALPQKKSGEYIVQEKGTLGRIAKKFGCTIAKLEQLNGISRDTIIRPGDMLFIPAK